MSTTLSVGAVEISLPAGGDLQQASNGDIALVQNTSQSAAATIQRLYRLLGSITINAANNVLPSDYFNPDTGANEPVVIGMMITPQLLPALQARITAGLSQSTEVATIDAINVSNAGGGLILDSIQLTDVTGNPITLGPLPTPG